MTAQRRTARRPRCDCCGFPIWLYLAAPSRLPTLGTVSWCPECHAPSLKYTGLVVTAGGVLLLFVCKACGLGREEREPIAVEVAA